MPFNVWVANFSDHPHHLPKHQNICIVAPTPTVIYHRAHYTEVTTVAKIEGTDTKTSETQVSVAKINNLKETFEETAKRQKIIQDSDKEHVEANWRDVINISDKCKE